MNKILSVILVIIGCFLIYSAVLNTIVRIAVVKPPEVGVVIVLLVLGGLALWGGIRLWDRWRMSAGIMSIVLALSALGNTMTSVHHAGRSHGREAELYQNLSAALPFLVVAAAILGVWLIVLDVRRKRAKAGRIVAGDALQ